MRMSRLATMLLLGSMITFNAPCGRLDLGGNRAHGADTSSALSLLAAQEQRDRAAGRMISHSRSARLSGPEVIHSH